MVSLGIRIVVALALFGSALAARGQFDRRPSGPMIAIQPLFAMQEPSIQAELQLSPEQRDRVATIAARLASDIEGKKRRARRNPLAALDSARLRKEGLALLEDATDSALGELTPDQRRRLREVCVQVGGSLAAANREVQKEISLTADQRRRIDAEVVSWRRVEKRADSPKVGEASLKETQNRISAILSPEQRARLNRMQGAPFRWSPSHEDSGR